MELSLKIYGIRGSMPSSENGESIFGKNTSCFYINTGEESIVLDAGTGIVPLGDWLVQTKQRKVSILISHVHLDHIQGIPFFLPFFSSDFEIHIYSQMRHQLNIQQQIQQMMSKPLWPVGTESFHAKVIYHTINSNGEFLTAGGTRVRTSASNHPDDATVFRIEKNNISMVYALDYEHDEMGDTRLISFADNCNLLIYDAFYIPELYPQKIGWGHSTWREGIRIAQSCHAKRTIMAHISPFLSEKELRQLDSEIQEMDVSCSIGKEGEEALL